MSIKIIIAMRYTANSNTLFTIQKGHASQWKTGTVGSLIKGRNRKFHRGFFDAPINRRFCRGGGREDGLPHDRSRLGLHQGEFAAPCRMKSCAEFAAIYKRAPCPRSAFRGEQRNFYLWNPNYWTVSIYSFLPWEAIISRSEIVISSPSWFLSNLNNYLVTSR